MGSLEEWHLRILGLFHDPTAWFERHQARSFKLGMGALSPLARPSGVEWNGMGMGSAREVSLPWRCFYAGPRSMSNGEVTTFTLQDGSHGISGLGVDEDDVDRHAEWFW